MECLIPLRPPVESAKKNDLVFGKKRMEFSCPNFVRFFSRNLRRYEDFLNTILKRGELVRRPSVQENDYPGEPGDKALNIPAKNGPRQLRDMAYWVTTKLEGFSNLRDAWNMGGTAFKQFFSIVK